MLLRRLAVGCQAGRYNGICLLLYLDAHAVIQVFHYFLIYIVQPGSHHRINYSMVAGSRVAGFFIAAGS